tara:strand:- start:83683 stop:86136 length:2454 start_codon:yes stop_codon:yes gene_type:complete
MRTFIFSGSFITFLFITFQIGFSSAQTNGKIQGIVIDVNTTETIPSAIVSVLGTDVKALADLDGNFSIEVPTGTYNIEVKYSGYTTQTKYNIQVTSGNAQILKFELAQMVTNIGEVTVSADLSKRAGATDMVTPNSVQRLTAEEIKSNPGGGYDVSKVVQTLPGVGGSAGGGARNDIIIRGGAPNENVYYLDGIEVPVLNHFQTQGSSGGAQGIINVAFIDELKLTSSAFDARYDNALASTFVIKQRTANREKLSGNIRASITETAFSLEGPLGKKTDFLAGGRFSYLDLLFQLIDLPIRPRYQDYQLNTTTRLNDKTTLKFVGLGAIDNFEFGSTREATPENEFLRRSLPIITQWTYTTGAVLNRKIDKGFVNIALSRNMLDNQIDRFKDAQYNNEEFRNFGLKSQEIENKLRVDVNRFVNQWKYSYGISAQYVKYNADLYNQVVAPVADSLGNVVAPEVAIRFKTEIDFARFGAFGQVSRRFFKDNFLVSMGVRSDMNTFTDTGMDPLRTLSPRASIAYSLTKKWEVSASAGRYFKLVPYTVLGYRNAASELVNRNADYIASNHLVIGTQYLPNDGLRFTAEAFYKRYSNYPSSVVNGISLANQGTEFGALGNEQVVSNGIGNTYGIELFAQQKLTKKVFYFVSYTYVRSFFAGTDGKLIPSAWDNRHLLSATLGYKWGKNWQLGAKYRLSGGNPYTPYDTVASQASFPVTFSGVLDFQRINENRLRTFSQLDIRIDKTWNLKKVSFVGFIDIQNILLTKQEGVPNYTFKRTEDNSTFETTDGKPLAADGSNGIPIILLNEGATVVPTIGLIIQF